MRVRLVILSVVAAVTLGGCSGGRSTTIAPTTTSNLAPATSCLSAAARAPAVTTVHALLLDIAPLTSQDVWAVGQSGKAPNAGLITHWDGKQWTDQQVPQVLYAIAAVGPHDIWASGSVYRVGSAAIMHYDGQSWQPQQIPPTPQDAMLISLAAVASDNVWAVGLTSKTFTPLVDHWDGKVWSAIDTTTLPARSVLKGATVDANRTVWAVGDYGPESARRALVVRLGPGVGQAEALAPTSYAATQLHGVQALTPDNVWAVGFGAAASGAIQPISYHYDGHGWTEVDMAPDTDMARARHVAGLSADDLWAVGDTGPKAAGPSLIEHWDGTRWSLQDNVGTYGRLFGVRARPQVGVLATGAEANVVPLCKDRISR